MPGPIRKKEERCVLSPKEVFESEPILVNEKGIKFWNDYQLNEYAETIELLKVKDVSAFFVEFSDGYQCRLICFNHQPVYEHTNLEALCSFLDVQKFLVDTDQD